MRGGSRFRRGFTLLELLVAIAILSIVTGVLVMIVYQFFSIPSWGNAQMAVDSDLRNAGLWLTRDGSESRVFTGTASCDAFTFETGHGAIYEYTVSEERLWRDDGGNTLGVGRHVSDVECPSGTTTGTVPITLFSSRGDVSVSQTYTVTMRVR